MLEDDLAGRFGNSCSSSSESVRNSARLRGFVVSFEANTLRLIGNPSPTERERLLNPQIVSFLDGPLDTRSVKFKCSPKFDINLKFALSLVYAV